MFLTCAHRADTAARSGGAEPEGIKKRGEAEAALWGSLTRELKIEPELEAFVRRRRAAEAPIAALCSAGTSGNSLCSRTTSRWFGVSNVNV